MNDTWIATKLCDTGWVHGIAVDNNGIIYFTSGYENVYQVRQDNINTEPHILVNIKEAKLNGIVWNGNNILYICDEYNHTILSYSIDTGNLVTLAGNGTAGHKDENTKNAEFYFPSEIARDRNGDLYITERHCVRKINLAEGTVTTIAGSNNKGYKDGDAKQAMFHYPEGIAISEDGTIYVCDRENHCIRQIKNGVVSTLAGTPRKQGYKDGPLSHSQFRHPSPLVMDVDGNLLITDPDGLRKLDLHQHIVSSLQGVSELICSLVFSNKFGLFGGGYDCIMKIEENKWKWKRWIWIGHLKENPNDCLLATLPKDIIKEITQLI